MIRRSIEIREILDRLVDLEDKAAESKSEAFKNCVEAVGSMVLSACKSACDFMAATLSLSDEIHQEPTEQSD